MAVAWSRRRERTTDELLIRQLFQEHGGALLAYATRLMGDRPLGEQVVQEALIKAWANPERLSEDKGSVRSHLFTITRDIAVDRHRARMSRPAEVAEAEADSMVFLSALEALSPEQRGVLRSIYFQGQSVDEAAAALGVPAGTVKARSYHALRRLHDVLADPAPPALATIGEGTAR